jgi:hypothetical protein
MTDRAPIRHPRNGLLSLLGVHCWWENPKYNPRGKWIPYTREQVLLRRAARLICVVIVGGGALGGGYAMLPPLPPTLSGAPFSPAPPTLSGAPFPRSGTTTLVTTPEPGTLLILGAAIVLLWGLRKWG